MEDIIWENVLGFMKLLVAIWLLKILINFITIYGVLALGGSGCTGISCARNQLAKRPRQMTSVSVLLTAEAFLQAFLGVKIGIF
jgi:thiol:disulfide interchange protein